METAPFLDEQGIFQAGQFRSLLSVLAMSRLVGRTWIDFYIALNSLHLAPERMCMDEAQKLQVYCELI